MPVINGTGNEDFPRGHSVADVIFEFGDDDGLFGLWGDDTLLGNGGTDSLGGGRHVMDLFDEVQRTDTVTDFGLLGDLSMNLATGLLFDAAPGDIPIGLEGVVGTSLAELLVGNGFANLLSDGSRRDLLTGSPAPRRRRDERPGEHGHLAFRPPNGQRRPSLRRVRLARRRRHGARLACGARKLTAVGILIV